MKESTLLGVGATGVVVAAICCATPILVVLLGALGLSAWTAKLDYVLLPIIAASLALVAFALYRRWQAAAGCAPPTKTTKDALDYPGISASVQTAAIER